MPKASSLYVIMQQLAALSLVDLFKLRAIIDALIEEKSSPPSNILSVGSYQRAMSVSSETRDIDIAAVFPPMIPGSSIRGQIRSAIISGNLEHINLDEYQVVQFSKSEAKGDDSLEKVIKLVDEWMADESGYDEQTYPQIETALNQNQLSL
ncbi:MAG: hypothetical protein RMY64_19910 [Nostoc sp. DedQUE08]|uniref:hypothetical protein n=1 Tax=unclassified Nostoc TaxID=2593658 RepID=UPI002AD35A73|nr:MULTISPECIES: hypothetical protein [unclassified Nostoc]MDZ8067860.1 hypothetical protein [Nostoc sp. DedQUE08]MDZ8136996.1 hypothetical protein [Nostoc sp. DedQUE04]